MNKVCTFAPFFKGSKSIMIFYTQTNHYIFYVKRKII